jgi:essential nuclear protein 1
MSNHAVSGSNSYRHQNPLSEDLAATGLLRTKAKKRKAGRADDARDGFIDARASRKILKIGQELVEEETEGSKAIPPSTAFTFESRFDEHNPSEEELRYEDEEGWGDEDDGVVEEVVCLATRICPFLTKAR